MEAKRLIMQRVLLNCFHSNPQDGFIKSMPQEDAKAILNQSVQAADARPAFAHPEEKLGKIHYSWIISIFEKKPEAMKPLLFSILPESIGMGLCKYFHLTYTPFSISPVVRRYFSEQIYNEIDPQAIQPIAFLPSSPLNILTDLSKNDLVELIDFLALFDLAEEMRHIVDQKNLKKIYNCLSPKQQQYFRVCLHQKVKFTSPKLELELWHGDCKQLQEILHRRGIQRLGKALSGQHPDLLWHIFHILDTGRAAALQKNIPEKDTSGVAEVIIQQVTGTLNFLKKKSEP